ncbi:hypothetical protein EV647_0299 [Kribbella sp. VKM Ac-2566]|jgi:hypothetical protein|nr:hypothetical protein EV647_0299 [Kribbella sp. VKM Ac-2566]
MSHGSIKRLTAALSVAVLVILPACSADQSASPSPSSPTASSSGVRPVAGEPLPAGTYVSEIFKTPLTYTVPAGWKMFEDEPGQFGLTLVANDHPCVCVWRDVRAAATTGAEEPEPGVGTSAKEITTWLAHHKWLKPATPKAVTVGGLTGYVIDVAGNPKASTLIGSGLSAGVHWEASSIEGSSQRVYLLDLGKNGADGNIAINIEICCGVQRAERLAAVEPVLKTFTFKTD